MTGVLLLPVGEGMGAFYRRRIGRIVPPLLFWSLALPLLFFAYLHTFGAATQSPTVDPASYTVRQLVVRLYTFVFNFNYDTTPLWYLYMLVGLYLVMPVLGAWLRQASQRDLQLFLAVWGAALLLPYVCGASATGTPTGRSTIFRASSAIWCWPTIWCAIPCGGAGGGRSA